ncbi:hypothetical protein H7X87_04200 [Acetobacteraceae bacterium]|nr:hypothetical protein [Candidatus Parcubacteria bacterium]
MAVQMNLYNPRIAPGETPPAPTPTSTPRPEAAEGDENPPPVAEVAAGGDYTRRLVQEIGPPIGNLSHRLTTLEEVVQSLNGGGVLASTTSADGRKSLIARLFDSDKTQADQECVPNPQCDCLWHGSYTLRPGPVQEEGWPVSFKVPRPYATDINYGEGICSIFLDLPDEGGPWIIYLRKAERTGVSKVFGPYTISRLDGVYTVSAPGVPTEDAPPIDTLEGVEYAWSGDKKKFKVLVQWVPSSKH